MHWRRKWEPTPVFLPGESQGQGEPGGLPSMGSHRVRHDLAAAVAAAGKRFTHQELHSDWFQCQTSLPSLPFSGLCRKDIPTLQSKNPKYLRGNKAPACTNRESRNPWRWARAFLLPCPAQPALDYPQPQRVNFTLSSLLFLLLLPGTHPQRCPHMAKGGLLMSPPHPVSYPNSIHLHYPCTY